MILTCAAETWTTTKSDEKRLSIFCGKILHRIFGPICEGGQGGRCTIENWNSFTMNQT
jgi:hypothetical protein